MSFFAFILDFLSKIFGNPQVIYSVTIALKQIAEVTITVITELLSKSVEKLVKMINESSFTDLAKAR